MSKNYLLDPVTLTGEGQYNFNSIKQIDVTESFLGIDQEITKCQNMEPYEDCTTRHYLSEVKNKCGCLPYAISQMDKVYLGKFVGTFQFLLFRILSVQHLRRSLAVNWKIFLTNA